MSSQNRVEIIYDMIANLQPGNLNQGVKKINDLLKGIKLSDKMTVEYKESMAEIEKGLKNFQTSVNLPLTDDKSLKNALKDYKALEKALAKMQTLLNKIGLDAKDFQWLPDHKDFEKFQLAEQVGAELEKVEGKLEKAFGNFKTRFRSNFQKTGELGLDFNMSELIEAATVPGGRMPYSLSRGEYAAEATILKEIAATKERLVGFSDKLVENEKKLQELKESSDASERQEEIEKTEKTIERLERSIEIREEEIASFNNDIEVIKNLREAYESLKKIANLSKKELAEYAEEGEGVYDILQKLVNEALKTFSQTMEEAGEATKETRKTLEGFEEPLKDIEKHNDEIKRGEQELANFQRRLLDFFSVSNGWNLVRKVISNAFKVVKELDAAMTDIAVVTEMTLDQVWTGRETYSKTAQELGAATLDVVKASTLYYQQGLSEAEVNEVTTETIKMGRIARIDGARATDLMTSAVRGFNLEMKDSIMINDTYSQIAAKSAANVEELANAMTKTAAIAHSAGADFQNMTAFLAQMIETTREPSESLGTAMKTIVARFQEIKKAPDEIGEIDGETVDANALEKALRSVGIALRDANGEFRKFDDVIFEISANWASMDKMSQRYIATTAAGSRQQSRFIALVQNHERLMELTGYATDNAGASNEQFEKTLDSLEAKMNKMKNALDLLWTTLMNSDLIKIVIDFVTKLVEIINKLTQSFGSFGGSIVGIGLALTSFKVGGTVLEKILGSVGQALGVGDKKAKGFGQTLLGLAQNMKSPKEALSSFGTSIGSFLKNLKEGRLGVTKTVDTFKILEDGTQTLVNSTTTHGKSIKELFSGLTKYVNLGKFALIAAAITGIAIAIERVIVTDKERLALLEESSKRQQELIDTTSQQIEELKSGLDGLRTSEETLNSLTRGTTEWKEALIKTNNEVLNLINTYPELISTVQRAENGRLTISPESYDAMIEQQQKMLATQQLSYLQTQIEEVELNLKIDEKSFAGLRNQVESSFFGVEPGELKNIAAAFSAEGLQISELQDNTSRTATRLKELYSAVGGVIDNFDNFKTIVENNEKYFVDFGANLNMTNKQLTGFANTFSTFIIDSDPDLAALLDNTITKPIVEAVLTAGIGSGKHQELVDEAIEANTPQPTPYFMEKAGVEPDYFTPEQLIVKYAAQEGTTSTAVKEKLASKEITIQELARIVGMKEGTDKFIELSKKQIEALEAFSSGDPRVGGALTRISGTDPNLVTSEDIKVLGEYLKSTTIEKDLESFGMTLEDIQKAFDTVVVNDKAIIDEFKNFGKEWGPHGEILGSRSGFSPEIIQDYDNLIAQLSLTTKDGFTELMLSIFRSFGEASMGEVLEILTQTLGHLNAEEMEKAINLITATDLTDLEALDELRENFKKAEIVIDDFTFDNMIKGISGATHAIRKMDFSTLEEKVSSASKLLDTIQKGDGGVTLSEDDYKAVVEFDSDFVDVFSRNLDGTYTYLSTDMTKLREAIISNTQSLIAGQKLQIQSKLEAAALLQTEGLDVEKVKPENYGKFILEFIEEATKQGIDVTQLGLGISSDFSLEGLSYQTAQGIFEDLKALIYGDYQTQLDTIGGVEAAPRAAVSSPGELSRLAIEAVTEKDVAVAEAYAKALQAQGLAAGLTEEDFKTYRQAVKNQNLELMKSEGATLDYKIALKQLEKTIKASSDSMFNHVESLKEMKEGSLEYNNVLSEMSKEMNETFGTHLDEDFFAVEENLDLLSQALTGNEGAWDQLLHNIDEAALHSSWFAEQFGSDAQYINTIASELDKVKFDIEGRADLTNLFNTLLAAGMEIENVAKAVEALGYTGIEYKVVGYTEVRIPDPYDSKSVISHRMPRIVADAFGFNVAKAAANRISSYGGGAPSSRSKGKGGGGGGKGGGGKEELPWENSYDWLYNILQDINKAIRERNILEWKYEKMLQERKYIAQDLLENRRAQRDLLEEELELQKQELQGREAELTGLKKKHSGVSSYVWWDEITQSPKINWELVNENKDPTRGEQIEEALSDFEQVSDQIHDLITGQMQTIDEIQVLQNLGKDDWLDLEDRVLKALIAQYQAEIDELSTINDSINDTNARLLDAVQNSLNKIRQDRENEKTTKSIQDKESRLAYLRQDTSGANAMEILALERELEEDKESYTDTLIDQKITELQEQNDLAAKQRERQIELSQAALDTAVEQGELWDETFQVLSGALGTNGQLSPDFMAWVGRWENTKAMSTVRKEDWEKGLEAQVKSGFSWLTDQAGYDNIKATQDNLKNGLSGMNTIQTNIEKNQKTIGGDIVGAIDRLDMSPVINVNVPPAVVNVSTNTSNKTTSSNSTNQNTKFAPTSAPTTNSTGTPGNSGYVPPPTYTAKNLSQPQDQHQLWQIIDNNKNKWELAKYQGVLRLNGTVVSIDELKKKFPNMTWSGGMKAYKKGGLADFTGPAWLDGTKKKPESVLDAVDTSNLIQLKDILRDILRSSPSKTEYSTKGDSYYDIKIEVDELSNDYDVDRVIEKIKKELAEEGAYRNVNIVNRRMKY